MYRLYVHSWDAPTSSQVVVDSFAESRQKDLLHLAEELEHENEQDKKHLETCHLTENEQVGIAMVATTKGFKRPFSPECDGRHLEILHHQTKSDLSLICGKVITCMVQYRN